MSAVLRPFQAALTTTRLEVRQWLIFMAMALPVIVVTEIGKRMMSSAPARKQAA